MGSQACLATPMLGNKLELERTVLQL